MFLTIFGTYNCFWRFPPPGHSNSLSIWEMLNSPKTFYLIPTKWKGLASTKCFFALHYAQTCRIKWHNLHAKCENVFFFFYFITSNTCFLFNSLK
jgi:hypothetical protein